MNNEVKYDDEELSKILINLTVISKIQQNNKFYINNEKYVIVGVNNIFLTLYRIYNNIDRKTNIENLKEIYNNIFRYIDNLISQYQTNYKSNITERENNNSNDILSVFNNNINAYDKQKEFEKKLQDIKSALSRSIAGLKNLQLVYINDLLIDSQIDVIINKSHNNIKKILDLNIPI